MLAFVRPPPRTLLAHRRKQFLEHYKVQQPGNVDKAELTLFHTLLANDPANLEAFTAQLVAHHVEQARRAAKRKQVKAQGRDEVGDDSEDSDASDQEWALGEGEPEPENVAALSVASLADMDPKNAPEVKAQQRRLLEPPASKNVARKSWQFRKALRKARLHDEGGSGAGSPRRHVDSQKTPITKEVASGAGRPSRHVDINGNPTVVPAADPRAKSDTAWMRPFTPGHVGSDSELPAKTVKSVFNHPPRSAANQPRMELIARYEHPGQDRDDSGAFGTKSHTRSHPIGDTVAQHQKIKEVLEWLWGKHEWCCTLEGEEFCVPTHVFAELGSCSQCAAGCCTVIEEYEKSSGLVAEPEVPAPSGEHTSAVASESKQNRSDSDSTSSSTSDSDSSEPKEAEPPAHVVAPCICGVPGHCVNDCVFVRALQTGSDEDIAIAEAMIASLSEEGVWRDGASVQLSTCSRELCAPADGNCLFSSFEPAYEAASNGVTSLAPHEVAQRGAQLRKWYVEWIHEQLKNDATIGGFKVASLLLDNALEYADKRRSLEIASYISRVDVVIDDSPIPERSWGSLSELLLLSHERGVRTLVVRMTKAPSAQLWADVGPAGRQI